jgi:hypothetical protein
MEYEKRNRKRARTIGTMISSLKDEAELSLRLYRRKSPKKPKERD